MFKLHSYSVGSTARWVTLWLLCGFASANAFGDTPPLIDDVNLLYQQSHETALTFTLSTPILRAKALSSPEKSCWIRLERKNNASLNQPLQQGVWKDGETTIINWELESKNDQVVLQVNLNAPHECRVQLSGDQRNIWVTLTEKTVSNTEKSKSKLNEIKKLIATGQAKRARRLLQAWVDTNHYPPEALEYWGVALERLGQFPQAQKRYQLYLQQYPDDTVAKARILARIDALQAMTRQRPKDLRQANKKFIAQKPKTQFYGNLSEYYRTYRLDLPGEASRTVQSELSTNLDLRGRYRDADKDIKLRFSGGYLHDLLNRSSTNTTSSDTRLSALYLDALFKKNNHRVQIGRFSSPVGVLGYLDGLDYSMPVSSNWRVHGIAGFPVKSTRDTSPNTEEKLYGMNLDFTPLSSPWSNTLFLTQSTRNGLTERRALGDQLRYQSEKVSGLVYLDYDLFFGELNTIYGNANWKVAENDHIHASFDYRRSPTLTLSNAVIGQGVLRIEQLMANGFSEGQLQEMALDRTAISKSLSVGWDHPVDKQLNISLNLDSWKLSSTKTSQGVQGFEGTQWEYSLDTRLQWRNLWQSNTAFWWSLRYSHYTQNELYSTSANARIPWNRQWSLRPIIRIDRRDLGTSGSETILKPEVQINYDVNRDWHWELTVGGEQISSQQGAVKTTATDYYLFMGFNYGF